VDLEHSLALSRRVARGRRADRRIERRLRERLPRRLALRRDTHFGSSYGTPGWQRAQRNKDRRGGGFGGDGFEEENYSADDFIHAGPAASPPPRGGEQGGGIHGRGFRNKSRARLPVTIEGELVAKSTGTISDFSVGDRVFHQKFGNGNVTGIDGNKLTIAFDKAGEKRVVDSFVERV
jgi:DNA helicase-2/ATP-dependent DNA helicase PcrA